MIKVLIADDNQIVRRGLGDVIESASDMHVVAEAWDGQSAVDAARQASPDVVLMDIRMPGMDGLTATRHIRQLALPPRILILTTFSEDEYVHEAVQSGANGFLLKDSSPEDILRAVRDLAAGGGALDSTVTERVLDTLASQAAQLTSAEAAALESLTERETEVLRLVGRGLSNAAIGAELHLTEGTVKGMVSRLLAKIGADNRVQAARLAYRAGLER
ncbi:response regulator transcription factor [Streptomyces formicae]|uniref:Response regulator transcription factor n=1 Tax=Streptomyces formicae TaxID=1616117 RepID=A0ABY3WVR2_9ACTN|nr:response regulator transcription factor [Streptomyces formicae]UNM16741.1 response regulator transcription factor [Streptomyces formicae]